MASGWPPLRVPLLMIETRGRSAWTMHFGVRDRLPVMADDQQVGGAEPVGRAHQLGFLVPGQVAGMRRRGTCRT